ncbi:MAG TPA: undecaprenyl-phosphate alpha-N-acetylglucosaminyl 1-phosphate transferase [Pelotomaculum sp.]|nr:undecaprenyl-phosphate alpha-N-acetylglucosaminyl 1-phosphate transferase [Pelotomaculum sp.]
MQISVTAILLALGAVLLITPLVRKLAFKWGALDRPNQRKVHQQVMPRLGGLAVFIAFTTAVLLTQQLSGHIIGLLLGGGLIILLGFVDDTRGISPRVKLAGQLVAACAVAVIPFFGLRVEILTNPFSDELLTLGFLSIPVTVLWIVSVTNAVNLIDGLDGLAGGTVCIASLTLAAVVWIETNRNAASPGQYEAIALALILAAAVFGFLRYNFYPAKIFLGDTGSMYLGFSVAVLSVMGLAKSATFISVIIPMVILGIPLLDTICAIIRRFNGQKPILQPDKQHLHHRLMSMGLNHRQAVLCIYGVNIVLGLSAILLTLLTPKQAIIFLVVLSTAVLILANKLGVTGVRSRAAYTTQPNKQQRSSHM